MKYILNANILATIRHKITDFAHPKSKFQEKDKQKLSESLEDFFTLLESHDRILNEIWGKDKEGFGSFSAVPFRLYLAAVYDFSLPRLANLYRAWNKEFIHSTIR